MDSLDSEEARDPAWTLLSRAPVPEVRTDFAGSLTSIARTTGQDAIAAPSVVQIFSSAPAGWRSAAAAVVLFSAGLTGLSLLSEPDPVRISKLDENTTLTGAIADWTPHQDAPAGLSPLEEIIAVDELDQRLDIESGESLENEDLLLLLFPDWELL